MIQLGDILLAFVTIILGLMTYFYDRGSRYRYLAERWNELMNMNVDVPDFFDSKKTAYYKTWGEVQKAKYNQYARMYWGFIEDVIRKDNPFDRLLGLIGFESYVEAYTITIRDCISLHHAWLRDNKERFTYLKFRKVLSEKFWEELKQVSLEL